MAPFWQPYASFWHRYRLTILILVALAAVSVGGLYARGQPLDVQLFRTINTGYANAALDALSSAGWVLGSFWFSLALFLALFLLGYRRFAISAAGAIAVGSLLVLLIKGLTRQMRPWQVLQGVRLVSFGDYGPGFPSGHAAQAWLTAYLLAGYFRPPWYAQAGLYGLASYVALSRVYVGEHFPVDVLAGSLIGLLFGVLWAHSRLWPGAHPREQQGP